MIYAVTVIGLLVTVAVTVVGLVTVFVDVIQLVTVTHCVFDGLYQGAEHDTEYVGYD